MIRAPAKAPDEPSLLGSFFALTEASKLFDAAPGVRLTDVLWTHGAALRQGLVAKTLSTLLSRAPCVQGFLVLYARDVRSPLVYGEKTIPLRVRDGIEVPTGAGGPYLVLIVCERTGSGMVEAICGYAQPIYHARRFVPVASDLERDVLRVLEHLQLALDAHGVELDLACEVPGEVEGTAKPTAHRLNLALHAKRAGDEGAALLLTVRTATKGEPDEDAFQVEASTLADGTLVSWLEAQLERFAGNPGAAAQ